MPIAVFRRRREREFVVRGKPIEPAVKLTVQKHSERLNKPGMYSWWWSVRIQSAEGA
jgi:hypothetical protein